MSNLILHNIEKDKLLLLESVSVNEHFKSFNYKIITCSSKFIFIEMSENRLKSQAAKFSSFLL